MCGFSGFLRSNSLSTTAPAIIDAMISTLRHRGPDDEGIWLDRAAGIAFGHRRLSIVDLSPSGHQPMESQSGRYVLVFNGEIYNHDSIRADLEKVGSAPFWRGHSDTETLLAAVDEWGVEASLKRTVGMFALALWDRKLRQLYLARDRFGEKPLYFGWMGGNFLFGSELKALRAHPAFDNSICTEALHLYLQLSYVPAPQTIYKNVYKLEPGCILKIRPQGSTSAPNEELKPGYSDACLSLERWWNFADVVRHGAKHTVNDESEALEELERRLREAIQLQSLADVPLGAFLSGGVDSSTIVALMQTQSRERTRTFTIGFEEAEYDESLHARAIAEHLGTSHTEIIISARQAQNLITALPWIYDEPFSDSSQIPTYLVSEAARQAVTVALSGDAGDEIFGGYNRYFWAPRLWSALSGLPYPVRNLLALTLQRAPNSLFRAISKSTLRPAEKLQKFGRALAGVRDFDGLYRNLIRTAPFSNLVTNGVLSKDLALPALPEGIHHESERMMYWDTLTYLPNDILCKVDRAAMAVSLETRAPFLDHRVVEYSWRLPASMKIRGNTGKWALRQILYKYVPKELIERPKTGFSIPLGTWLRDPLREWAEHLLNPARLRSQGQLNATLIEHAWRQHLKGTQDFSAFLWSILMYQAWLDTQR